MHSALIVIGLSVLMHVSWNLLARHVEARCNFLWWGLLAHLVMLGPWGLWRLYHDSLWSQELLLVMLVSAMANAVYFLALRKAYHFAPVALVYPLARSSPVLIVLWTWWIFDESILPGGITGIAISVVGLWLLAGTSTKGDTSYALPWALLAALATSVYSLSDKHAIQYLPTFGAQLGFISVGYFIAFIGLSLFQYRENKTIYPACRPYWRYILPGGFFIGVAYALVVRAMLILPAAYVVAYTNAGIVLATLLSIGIFKEYEQWRRRLFAVLLICIGLLVLGLHH
jgi:phosphonate utilization associated putative membrane protein